MTGSDEILLKFNVFETFYVLRKVDTVIFGDKLNGLGRQKLCCNWDAHFLKDWATGFQITIKGAVGNASQSGQLRFIHGFHF